MAESLQMQVQGDASAPRLVYLPGLHGDWHYNAGLRDALKGHVQLVELAYPREPSWKLEDYVQAIEAALLAAGFREGWLLGESFGSQVAWGMIGRAETQRAAGQPHFQPKGLILAGGFVRYPLMWGVRLVRGTHQSLPMAAVAALLRGYLRLLRWRHRQAPHVRQSLQAHQDFQLQELARQAILSRYDIILAHDHRPLAQRTTLPVFYLTGFWDLIVPWFLVQPWLRRHCPGYRGWRLVWNSEHNILGFQPRTSASQILAWLKANGEPVL
ncbi:MAG: alpha/beta hydrolase [Verrucomicrobiae bacterium]|nr:alpha/beta hydrolase [Verrucomicrobiae bacterium]